MVFRMGASFRPTGSFRGEHVGYVHDQLCFCQTDGQRVVGRKRWAIEKSECFVRDLRFNACVLFRGSSCIVFGSVFRVSTGYPVLILVNSFTSYFLSLKGLQRNPAVTRSPFAKKLCLSLIT